MSPTHLRTVCEVLVAFVVADDFECVESNEYGVLRVGRGVVVIERSNVVLDDQVLEPSTKYEFNFKSTVGFLMQFNDCPIMRSLLLMGLSTWRLYYGN